MLFGRQPEAVVAEGMQDVCPGHALVAGKDVGGDVAEGMADVQTRARGVGEHVENEQLVTAGHLVRLGEWASGVRSVERAVCIPRVLPLGFDLVGKRRAVAEGGDLGIRAVARNRGLGARCRHSLRIVDEPDRDSTVKQSNEAVRTW